MENNHNCDVMAMLLSHYEKEKRNNSRTNISYQNPIVELYSHKTISK
jgi:hypothetical protein